jgi:hypothetical protein
MYLVFRPFLMAMAVRQRNTKHINRCGMSRVTPQATGRCYWATTCSVLPQRLPGQQANKHQWTNTPTLLAILMAMAMRRYIAVCIARRRRSRDSLEATGWRHQASILSNNIKWNIALRGFFNVFHCQQKRVRSKRMAPTNTRGMTYQTKD